MENPKDIKKPGSQNPTVPTDQGEDSEERREAAERAWKDRQGMPRGTPEQGERSADRVGGSGGFEPEPEIEDDENQSSTKRTPGSEDVGDEGNKRRASEDDDVA